MHAGELEGLSFRCLEACGFCCTFTPEVAHDELARLRRSFPALPVVREGDRMHLAFQGGCGACTLLSRRACTAYADRPAHCRYFPFHVYFGRRTQVYVNRACRGVEQAPGASLARAFEEQVVAVAKPHAMLEHERRARKVHAEFRRNAQEAGMWGDADSEVAAAMARPDLFRRAAQGPAWQGALASFAEQDVVARPFYLAPDLRWITFEPAGESLQPLEMDEAGGLAPAGPSLAVRPELPDAATQDALRTELRRLAGRDLLAGMVFDDVDDSGYLVSVPAAAARQVEAVAAGLLVRAAILEGLGVAAPRLAEETVRFHDAAFLDSPTIGGWL